MAIGERIKYIRNLRGLTQKELGMAIGFDEKTADIRVAQYESGTRTPKANYVESIAKALEVSTFALNVPDTDSYFGLIHTLFALEDTYGIKINSIDGELCFTLDKENPSYVSLFEMLCDWKKQTEKLNSEKISKEEYDNWRYNYPEIK